MTLEFLTLNNNIKFIKGNPNTRDNNPKIISHIHNIINPNYAKLIKNKSY